MTSYQVYSKKTSVFSICVLPVRKAFGGVIDIKGVIFVFSTAIASTNTAKMGRKSENTTRQVFHVQYTYMHVHTKTSVNIIDMH